MRILITGICGFVGRALTDALLERVDGVAVSGIDNLIRPGSESNRARLKEMGIEFVHGDVRMASDFEALPKADWVIDAAANPSVLAGVNGTSSRQLFEHNLASAVNVLEYCKKHGAGLLMLSSSRVYSIPALSSLPLKIEGDAFALDTSKPLPGGVSICGIGPSFSTAAPVSLYGSTKLASEVLALEYGSAFDFPVWINRCGVLTGAGQFGTPDQGIFSYWLNAHKCRRPLRYIGFNGTGRQVRDAFHPGDLADLLLAQMNTPRQDGRRTYTAGGGPENTMSLAQLNDWCDDRFGRNSPAAVTRPRPYDIPWIVMDYSEAQQDFGWAPKRKLPTVLEEIADHAEQHPEWLQVSGV